MAGPRLDVEGRFHTPPRVGLLASATTPDPDPRVGNGITWEPEACTDSGSVGAMDPCNVVSGDKDIASAEDVLTADAVGIFAGYECTPLQLRAHDFTARASRKFAACESNLIATELWRGNIARSASMPQEFLASLNSDVVSPDGAGMTPAGALACLEQGLAECSCGERGMIHATRQVVTEWAAADLVRREGNLILTIHDTIVVADAGYDGSGPPTVDGGAPTPAADGAVWAYATGQIIIHRTPVGIVPGSIGEATNRTTNLIEVRAERAFAAQWDWSCCHLAAQIDVDLCGVGGS